MRSIRKRLSALLLCAAVITQCGCEGGQTAENSTLAVSEASVSTAESVDTEAVPNEVSAPDNNEAGMTLDDISFGELSRAKFETDSNIAKLLGTISGYSGLSYRSPTSFALNNKYYIYARRSCRQMGENALESAKKLEFDKAVMPANSTEVHIAPITDPLTVKVSSVEVSYKLFGLSNVRGFIRRISPERVECVIDPAFMGDIPLFSAEDKFMTFDINGQIMYGDTISFTSYSNGDELGALVGEDNYSYFYAIFDINDLDIVFDTEAGYSNTGDVSEIRVLTENTSDVIDSRYLFSADDKASGTEAGRIYNMLADNIDTLYNDKVSGINLLDMDLDGTPELLITKDVDIDVPYNSYETYTYRVYNVDVYGLKGDKPVLLGTIENVANKHDYTNSTTPYLYLKELPESEGGYAWLALTTDNEGERLNQRAKLFRLKDGKITDEEIFCLSGIAGEYELTLRGRTPEIKENTDDNGNTVYSVQTDLGEIPLYYDGYDMVCLSYLNSYSADIKKKALLLSDRLVVMAYNPAGRVYVSDKRLAPSERDILFDLAEMIDSFFHEQEVNDRVAYFEMWGGEAMKPVIYLYPEEETKVSVSVDFPNGGELTCTYPDYRDGWRVTAMPDGTLYDESGEEYYCLYWEGKDLPVPDIGEGFCVAGKDTALFLREKLMYMGLTAREANEFIIYWLPQMQDSPYNIITFHTDDYSAAAPLNVTPQPDSIIRLFMTYKPCEQQIEIPPQELPRYERNGFTLVEWGGRKTA